MCSQSEQRGLQWLDIGPRLHRPNGYRNPAWWALASLRRGRKKQECLVFQQVPQTQSGRCLPTFSTGLSTAWATGSVDKNDRLLARTSHGGLDARERSIDGAGVTFTAAESRLPEPGYRPGRVARPPDHSRTTFMSSSRPLREALKHRFYPFVQRQGFVRGKATALFVPFERVIDGKVQFFEIQWDKSHRPRFVVNFGERASPEHNELEPLPVQGRLQRWRGGSIRCWFQLGKPWIETLRTLRWQHQPDEVADQLVACFHELESWWDSKQAGPHVQLWHRANEMPHPTHTRTP